MPSRPRSWVVTDELWSRIEPLLPKHPRIPGRPGRPWLDDRQVLCGILFVLHTGIQWEFLPQELGYGSGMTCWRRLRDWNAAGIWNRQVPGGPGHAGEPRDTPRRGTGAEGGG